MRFKLSLSLDSQAFGNLLPANYQYELSAWIYHTLSRGDAGYSQWLHQNGYSQDQKQFRLFNFSNLQIPKLRMEGDRIVLLSDTADLFLTFLPEEATEPFIKGTFASQSFTIGDRRSKVQWHVRSIEMLASPALHETMTFHTLSPMVITRRREDGGVDYLNPEDPKIGPALIGKYLAETLRSKYRAFYQEDIDAPYTPDFAILSPAKKKKITIKTGTPQQSDIVGYLCRFRITLPLPLMHILYETGAGEKGSMGFGIVEVGEIKR